MSYALGMVETRGLVPMTEAADAAVKAANVEIIGWDRAGSGLSCVLLKGEVSAVRSAIDAAAAAAQRVGEVASVHVIPRPHEELDALKLGKPTPTRAELAKMKAEAAAQAETDDE